MHQLLYRRPENLKTPCVLAHLSFSNNVYLYDRETRSISMATDVPNRAIGDVVAEEPMHYEDGPIR